MKCRECAGASSCPARRDWQPSRAWHGPDGCLPRRSSVMATRWRALPCDGRGPDGGRLSACHPSSRLVAGTNSPAGSVDGLGTKPSKTVPSGLCKHARPCGAASQAACRDSEMLKKKPLDRVENKNLFVPPPLRIVLLRANHCLSCSEACRGCKHLALTYMLLCWLFICDADAAQRGVYGVAQVLMCVLSCCLCFSCPMLLLSILLQFCILGCDTIGQWRHFIIPLHFYPGFNIFFLF